MKTNYIYTAAVAALIISGVGISTLVSNHASAQISTSTSNSASAPMIIACVVPQQNLWYGESDTASNPQIHALQEFLFREGYVSSQSYVTGYFGPLTLASVKKFQAAYGVPATGFVGPLTRQEIANLSANNCASLGTGGTGGTGTTGSTTSSTTVSTAVTITSISPSSGAVGSSATITGTGFTTTNQILMNGNVAGSDIAPVNGTLTFTIPGSMGPYCKRGYACPMYEILTSKGTYTVTVLNDNGTSNSLTYTITSAPNELNNL